jgi:malate permease and related proteins
VLVFFTLLTKLIPLYLIILLGFIAGKYLDVKKETIAPLLIYIIVPVIIFNGVITTKITTSVLSLPILFFILSCFMCLLFFTIARFIWQDATKNILAFTAGTGNTGYFGLPVAIALFDKNILGIYVLSLLGFIIYENTLGFFIIAKGHHTIKESIRKVLTLPTVYAFFLGLFVNLSGVKLGSIYAGAEINFQGAFTILGMMMIGLGLSSIKNYKFDFKFLGLSFFAKFVAWPLLVFFIIYIDSHFFKVYDTNIYKIMILLSIVPFAANTVIFATQLKAHPEKASLAVLLSTLFALFYIPLMVIYFIK